MPSRRTGLVRREGRGDVEDRAGRGPSRRSIGHPARPGRPEFSGYPLDTGSRPASNPCLGDPGDAADGEVGAHLDIPDHGEAWWSSSGRVRSCRIEPPIHREESRMAMRNAHRVAPGLVLGLMMGLGAVAADEPSNGRGVGQRVDNFTLRDVISGKLVSLYSFRGKRPACWSSPAPSARSATSTSRAWWNWPGPTRKGSWSWPSMPTPTRPKPKWPTTPGSTGSTSPS